MKFIDEAWTTKTGRGRAEGKHVQHVLGRVGLGIARGRGLVHEPSEDDPPSWDELEREAQAADRLHLTEKCGRGDDDEYYRRSSSKKKSSSGSGGGDSSSRR